MATKAAVLPRKDAFAAVGEAIKAAADAMKKGTSDTRQAASQAMPAVGSALAKAVYTSSYYTSFCVVFAAVAVSRLMPSENALAYGIRDGAAAARGAGRDGSGRSTKTTPAARATAGHRIRMRRRSRTTRGSGKRVVNVGLPS
jgi:hypothetical protein